MNYFDFTNCSAGNIVHEIVPGDTYEKLAQQYNVSVEAITLANPDKNPNYLVPGHKLLIPHPQVKSSCNGIMHKVNHGETYTSIAKQYNVSERDLWAANVAVDLLHLQAGQVVSVPVKNDCTCPSGTRPYTVQVGDTPYTLVCKFNTTLDGLTRFNPDVNWKMLQPGQNLCVPMPWAEYTHPILGICFNYPSHWQKINDERYEGPDGFFQVVTIGGVLELDKFYQNDYYLCPGGGNHPAIFSGPINPESYPKWSSNDLTLLIIPAKAGNQPWKYVALVTGRNFLQEIARTLKFLL